MCTSSLEIDTVDVAPAAHSSSRSSESASDAPTRIAAVPRNGYVPRATPITTHTHSSAINTTQTAVPDLSPGRCRLGLVCTHNARGQPRVEPEPVRRSSGDVLRCRTAHPRTSVHLRLRLSPATPSRFRAPHVDPVSASRPTRLPQPAVRLPFASQPLRAAPAHPAFRTVPAHSP